MIARGLWLTLGVCALSLVGCGDDDVTPMGTDAGVDAGGPVLCADTRTVVALPTPVWQTETSLALPVDDEVIASRLNEIVPGWAMRVHEMDGWARRPTIVVPLDAPATAVDPTHVRVWVGAGGAPLEARELPMNATLVRASLVLVPRDPFPPDANEVVVAIEPAAITGARALPACRTGSTSIPDPGYAEALARIDGAPAGTLALAMRLSRGVEALPALRQRLFAAPDLVVSEATAIPIADLGTAGPPASAVSAYGARVVRGVLSLPDYRDAAGVIHLEPDGGPHEEGRTEPAFVVALPATGTPPYPWVIFQHGGGGRPTDVFGLAPALARAGFALVAIDLPEHGHRAPASGGGEVAFLDFDDLARMRANFMQASADHIAILTGVAALDSEISRVLGGGSQLDPARAFYVGLSLGAISGSMTFASALDVRAAGLFVGAGGYPDLVRQGLFSLFVADVLRQGPPERDALMGIGETLLDAADPIAYALRAEDRSVAPRSVVFFQAVDDPIVPSIANDQWARAFGAALAMPSDHEVPGMPALALPAAGNFTFTPGGPAATRILVQAPMAEIMPMQRHAALVRTDYAQELVAHCFTTLLATGTCEAIDTGFASH